MLRRGQEAEGQATFVGCDVLVTGDFNIHFANLCAANRRYVKVLDRKVLGMICEDTVFGCEIGNPKGQRTHESGTAIDMGW